MAGTVVPNRPNHFPQPGWDVRWKHFRVHDPIVDGICPGCHWALALLRNVRNVYYNVLVVIGPVSIQKCAQINGPKFHRVAIELVVAQWAVVQLDQTLE